MALVERLMGLADNGVDEAPPVDVDPTKCKISVHTFWAGAVEIVTGHRTVAQLKTYFNMDTAAQAEFDAWIALFPSGTTSTAVYNKIIWMERNHSVLMLAEDRATLYDTPTLVRAELGLPAQ